MSTASDSGADICLLLEGTYPFVPGGVSSWVHQIVSGMPDLRFALLHLSPARDHYREPVFAVPDNVVEIRETYLMQPTPKHRGRPPQALVLAFCAFVDAIRSDPGRAFVQLARQLDAVYADPSMVQAVLHGPEVWATLRRCYDEDAEHESFVDFYWNWICIHQPLLQVLATPLPEAAVYHTISTGYAGLLAAVAKVRTGRPMLITEHGIYTKERRIEVHAADWISSGIEDLDVAPAEHAPYFRRQWNQQFEVLGRICYDQADEIFTLFEGNRREQVQGGADPAKTAVIPNGIRVESFAAAAAARADRGDDHPFTVGFAGRIAPIKDLRTFLSAMRLVAERVPGLRVRVMGPADEDPHYAAECVQYVRQIGMTDQVTFEGRVDLAAAFADLDVLVLTSISEAQPLVVLEAGAAGLPAVCTDVGACAEMIEGRDAIDRQLGAGGIITPIASPGATARAVLKLWADPEGRRRMGRNLAARVREHYSEHALVASYRAIYERILQPASANVAREED